MGIVNKGELARDVAARTGIDIGEGELAVEATLEAIAKQIGDGNEVRLTGFGKFAAVQREAASGPQSPNRRGYADRGQTGAEVHGGCGAKEGGSVGEQTGLGTPGAFGPCSLPERGLRLPTCSQPRKSR